MKSGKALHCHHEAYKEIREVLLHKRKNGVGSKVSTLRVQTPLTSRAKQDHKAPEI